MKLGLICGFFIFTYVIIWALCKAMSTEYPDIKDIEPWEYKESIEDK